MQKLSWLIVLLLVVMAVGQERKEEQAEQKAEVTCTGTGDACPVRLHKWLCEVDVEWLAQWEKVCKDVAKHDPILVDPKIGSILFTSDPTNGNNFPFKVESYRKIDCDSYKPVSGPPQSPFNSKPSKSYRWRHASDIPDINALGLCFDLKIKRKNGTIIDPHIFVGDKNEWKDHRSKKDHDRDDQPK